jgi:hypothetical protein
MSKLGYSYVSEAYKINPTPKNNTQTVQKDQNNKENITKTNDSDYSKNKTENTENKTTKVDVIDSEQTSKEFDYLSLAKLMQNPEFDNIIFNYISAKYPNFFKIDNEKGKSSFSLAQLFSKSSFGTMDYNYLPSLLIIMLTCFIFYCLLK